jgi:hypothetical protein
MEKLAMIVSNDYQILSNTSEERKEYLLSILKESEEYLQSDGYILVVEKANVEPDYAAILAAIYRIANVVNFPTKEKLIETINDISITFSNEKQKYSESELALIEAKHLDWEYDGKQDWDYMFVEKYAEDKINEFKNK